MNEHTRRITQPGEAMEEWPATGCVIPIVDRSLDGDYDVPDSGRHHSVFWRLLAGRFYRVDYQTGEVVQETDHLSKALREEIAKGRLLRLEAGEYQHCKFPQGLIDAPPASLSHAMAFVLHTEPIAATAGALWRMGRLSYTQALEQMVIHLSRAKADLFKQLTDLHMKLPSPEAGDVPLSAEERASLQLMNGGRPEDLSLYDGDWDHNSTNVTDGFRGWHAFYRVRNGQIQTCSYATGQPIVSRGQPDIVEAVRSIKLGLWSRVTPQEMEVFAARNRGQTEAAKEG